MKIAIAGSHGVGKTTLAKTLAEKLGFAYIPDIVRQEAVKKGFVINENTPPEVHFWLTCWQWELEQTTAEDWIADKSLFDYLVYGEIVLKEGVFKRAIGEIVKRNVEYDLGFYLPIEFPMQLDGMRSKDLNFQKLVDCRYKRRLAEFKVKYIVLSGLVEKRVN
jgi:adenylate kinase family enzyme